ncbi:hypothetical protein ABGB18_11360 [Nonomuraea sp. B12E4]|uniref:hypothetical protein n=1 Tax=Nonomuraea sp. B12E4 TaxID=3153564 RepID=UPI00325C8E73
MTGRWLTLTAAASRIAEATGEHVSIEDVLLLGERHRLTVRWQHEHYSVLEESVTAYLAYQAAKPLTACGGDVLAENAGPPVGEGPDIGYEAESQYRREKGT